MTCNEWMQLIRALRRALKCAFDGLVWLTYTRVDEALFFDGKSLGLHGRILSVYGGDWTELSFQLVLLVDGSLIGYNPNTNLWTCVSQDVEGTGVMRWVAEEVCLGMESHAASELVGLLEAA